MTHTYKITGMTCSSCEAIIKSELLIIPHALSVEVSKEKQEAIIEMDAHIPFQSIQNAIAKAGSKYAVTELEDITNDEIETAKSWFETYKPILLIFFYIVLVTSIIQFKNTAFDFMEWMRHFMAGFFLVFSFFKLLNLKGFAESYIMYDVLAKRLPIWGYIYAFIELSLAIAYLLNYNPFVTNLVTLIVMSLSIIGVLQSVLNKKKIKCACLGAVFNLPMSTVTIIEEALMIAMALGMLILIY
jgi:copper chaperone CopZ